MTPCPDSILKLIQKFNEHAEQYRAAGYNETQVRVDFINPMFAALGWDMDNIAGYAEPYRDVVHEDAVKIGGTIKSPDYSFRIGGQRKFFLEAKKPAVKIKTDIDPAQQLRVYAWTAPLPLSILTNFSELAVYDCRVKPKYLDKASVARVLYLTSDEYQHRWGEIADVFSKDAILHGAFDKFVESNRKAGTEEFDDAFLDEMEQWRKRLAENLALRNENLDQTGLNFAVQRIIDRIIFLRICEDRGVEPPFQLQALLSGDNTYSRLREFFTKADQRYNSGLFHFQAERDRREQPDELTPGLDVDDDVLKQIIKRLYYPEGPYAFKEVRADILGNIYEQFLGNVIHLTAGHRARVEPKPEVRKAGGVYYTPTYVVDYIVRNTVGKLLEGKSPAGAAKLKIVDPACGSGSFLLGVYQYLLDWHLNWYRQNDPKKWTAGKNATLRPDRSNQLVLNTKERKRILLDNIYGVDIDNQAVEVTKLSLLLKVLEGETSESVDALSRLFHERALPDLGDNIKCGNSLIGPEIFDSAGPALSTEEKNRINAFDWNAEFASAFEQGGFDAVIGNPPYVLLQDEFRDDRQLSYFREAFKVASFKLDTYHLFIERGLRLTRTGGRFSMITPANFLTNNYLVGLRELLLRDSQVDHLLIIDGGVFAGISVDNAIFVVTRAKGPSGSFPIVHALPATDGLVETSRVTVDVRFALEDKYVLFTSSQNGNTAPIWSKISLGSKKLGDLGTVSFGKQLRDRKQYKKDVIEISSAAAVPKGYRPCYTGRDIARYKLTWNGLACLATDRARRGGCWDPEKQTARNKLVTPQIGKSPKFAIDTMGYDCLNTLFMVNIRQADLNPLYVLGLLNSRLLRGYWLGRFYDQRRTFPKIKGTYLKELPMRLADNRRQEKLVSLVKAMLDLHKTSPSAKTPHAKDALQREIVATDRRIDALVYQLYGLTDEEIHLVESATQ